MSFVNEGSNRSAGSQESWRPSPHQIIGVIVGILSLVFVAQNSKSSTIKFLLFEFTAPVWIAFLGILAAGAVLGFVLRGVWQDRRADEKAEKRNR